MANLKFAFLIILILAVYYQPIAGKCVSCPEDCCYDVRKGKPLPLRVISSYRKTSQTCGMDAVVLEVKSGKELCVEAEALWVKRLMKRIPKKQND
ncbi:C-C motif chemokine 22 [Crotalus tigris]|uniref:C-C motif chemokine 22 n=1 Tax=Crotalus tigris TaxID=88082 RepID=UPI00192F5FB9|nr:C-C motif chemokine 22 [Crotalus tigris]XP_039209790.1 C-C motif chemokine 22 [Crotalus tigris]